MQAKSFPQKTIALTLLFLAFSSVLIAAITDNSRKKKVSPALTVHELILEYNHFAPAVRVGGPSLVIQGISSSNPTNYIAGIYIPSNATITGLSMRAKMNFDASNDGEKILMKLYRMNNYGSRLLVTLVKSNYNIGNTDFRTKSRSLSIAATDEAYSVWLVIPDTTTVPQANFEVAWVKITYTTP